METNKEKCLLRITDVMTRTSLSRSHIYALVRRGQFPAPVKLGPKCARWVESDVDAWLGRAS